MGVGKYSPTVSKAYQNDQKWWEKNGGDVAKEGKESWHDNDGYDSYGYNKNDVDRAGNTESDYLTNYDVDYEQYTLAESTYEQWGINDKGLPAMYASLENKQEKKLKP